jgi:hypothetical protein
MEPMGREYIKVMGYARYGADCNECGADFSYQPYVYETLVDEETGKRIWLDEFCIDCGEKKIEAAGGWNAGPVSTADLWDNEKNLERIEAERGGL